MISPERIKVSLKRGVYFSKIGAKITEASQPLELGPHFKILKSTGRSLTSVGKDRPLTIMVDMIFDDLMKRKLLILPRLKNNALKDCIDTSPVMIAASFSRESLIQSFVVSGMIDAQT